jgi:hypothetical protein
MICGDVVTSVTGTRSFSGSNGSFANVIGAYAYCVEVNRIVCPSGALLAT